ncbi:MAG: hypothetical protein RR527_00100 [Clostridia bacterium]
MMKQFLSLLRVNYCNTFNINRIRYGKDAKLRSKQLRALVGFIALGVFMAFSMYGYFYGMAATLSAIGLPQLTMTLACAAACAVTLITTVFHAGNTLINYKDYDAVMSLPIPQSAVVLTRMLKLYTANLLFILALMIPAAAVYATLESPGAAFYIIFLITLPFLPMLPVVVAAIIGILINAATVGFKRKNIAGMIVTFLFVGAVMYFSMNSQKIIENIGDIGIKLNDALSRIYPPVTWYTEAIMGNWIKAVLLIGVNAIALFVFVALTGRFYRPLHALLTRQKRMVMKDEITQIRTPFAALFRKDMKRYLSSVLYVTNTAMGALLLILGGAALLIFDDKILAQIAGAPQNMGMLMTAAPFALSFCVVMSCTTNASISIEGNRLWQLKVMPVSVRKVFTSKLMVFFMMIVPAIVICGVLLCIALPVDFFTGALIFLTPLAHAAFIGVMGLVLNLNNPKLDWQSETEVIKSGTPVMLTVLGGMLAVMLPAGLIIGFGGAYGQIFTAAWTMLLCVIALVLWRWLITKGKRRFAEL